MPDFPNDDTQLDASERVRIASAGHTAEFAPAAGGRLTGLSTDGLDWIVPLAETDWPAAKWPRAGSYPLAPYSNRIRDGVFTFDGARHRLRSLAGRSEAIHGSGLYLPWQVRALEADSVDLVLDAPAGTMGWAWPFECVQRYRLDAGGLSLTLIMRNGGDTPMPFGFGIHPYFTARRVALHARRLWPADERGLPTGSKVTHVRELRQSAEGCDTYLSQWEGRATLHWDDGRELALRADPAFAHLVVYTAPGADFLCVEPVSNVADAFNLAAAGDARTGMRVLAPGERYSASLRMDFQRKARRDQAIIRRHQARESPSEKLSTEQLQATAEILRRVQERLARSGSLPLEPTLYACAKGYRRSVADYAWSWLSGLLAPHKSLSAWMDAHQPDWRAGKTPAAVVYARSENGWFSWLIAELEAEINDPQARARRDARG